MHPTSEFTTGPYNGQPARMVELSPEKCTNLLKGHHIGRVALCDERGLSLFPVNYVFDGTRLAIRSDVGSRLATSVQQQVAFEIDDISDQSRTGWSVIVTGTAYDISDALDSDSESMRALPVDPWAPGRKTCWVRIEPRSITGRLVGPA